MRYIVPFVLFLASLLPSQQAASCQPSIQIDGRACLGGMLDIKICAPQGCRVCFAVSINGEGPIHIGGATIPLTPPIFPIIEGSAFPCIRIWTKIPNEPVFVNKHISWVIMGYKIANPVRIEVGNGQYSRGTHLWKMCCP